jgi:hypothetical protein
MSTEDNKSLENVLGATSSRDGLKQFVTAMLTCDGYLAYPFHNQEVNSHAGNLNETYLNVDCKEKH